MPHKKPHPYQPEKDVHRITLYNTIYPEHQHRSKKERLYLHFDFACFYAQVEQLRRKMYGLPLIIGGWRKYNGQVKGIVATASYEARQFGIKTGMSAFEAYQLCPHVCMLQVDYDAYTSISKQVHFIFKEFAPVVERYSMDEYFMEIDFLRDRSRKEIDGFAKRLQDRIYEATHLVGSVGIARSKTYAKLSSSLNKPKGRTMVLTDEDERTDIWPLDVDEVWGVGRRRHEHILAEGYKTIGDVAERGNEKIFTRLFGANFGKMLFQTITGKDQGRVMEEISEDYKPKQGVSYGHTFSEGSTEVDRIKGEFAIGVQGLCYRMRGYGIRANSYSGMFGFNEPDKPGVGFRFVTPAHTNIDDYVYQALMEKVEPAIKKACQHGIEIRNIMLGTHQIDKTNQLNVFFQDDEDKAARVKAMDEIKNRFGQKYITKANMLHRVKGNTHFLGRNN
ncbi:DNA polymerase IV [Gracilimonas sp.]|uniref:Y-family DNA polymerase n=1 Tax=Gracilimonas sp. TaxID=1974203 RepID=UPI0032EC6E87